MASTKDLTKEFKKDYGESVGGLGFNYPDCERCPTGVFEFDMATGGGFPRGKMSIIYGMESSGKTNLALLAIAQFQRKHPKLPCTFMDVEHSFDPKWAAKLGVNIKKLNIFKPSFAEQVVDMVEALLAAEDCGIVVVDSIAALVTTQELESSAEKAVVGNTGTVMSKFTKKCVHAFLNSAREGRTPTLLCINQIAYKIGVMFGNPETLPGGVKQLFASSMTVRLYGKNEVDAKVSKSMPVMKAINCIVRKWKVPIVAMDCKFKLCMIPHKGLKVGQTNDWGTISTHMTASDLFGGDSKKGWWMVNIKGEVVEYKTATAAKEEFYGNRRFGRTIRAALIEQALEDVQRGYE